MTRSRLLTVLRFSATFSMLCALAPSQIEAQVLYGSLVGIVTEESQAIVPAQR